MKTKTWKALTFTVALAFAASGCAYFTSHEGRRDTYAEVMKGGVAVAAVAIVVALLLSSKSSGRVGGVPGPD